VGLKDVVERFAGKKQGKQLGSRSSPDRKRRRDEATVQVPSPIASRPPGQSPSPPPARPAAATPPPGQPAAPPATPPYSPPSSPPPSAQPASPPSSPPPAPPAARADSAEATQYVTVPGMGNETLLGVMVGIGGQLEGEIYKVFDRDVKLGRAQDCDLKLLDPKISREHARIVVVDGALMVVPLSDKNPVYVNDQVVEEAEQLSDGDKLQLGNPGTSVFRFRTIEGT
jgi:pSer/pThr/pTyr-binding forkhead associated (FHA) protein